jgi:hypothetical protein
MLFTEFLNNRDNILEARTIRISHHLSSSDRMKQARLRKSSSYKMKQKILARLRARKHCPNGQVVDYDGKGCHKPKHLVGLKKRD